jgi:hypothetical protein
MTVKVMAKQLSGCFASRVFPRQNYGQTWTWNTLTAGPALSLTTSGTAAANDQTVLYVTASGANSTSGVVYVASAQQQRPGLPSGRQLD